MASTCRGEPIGDVTAISETGCRFPDVAFSSAGGEYFVVWADYTPGKRGVYGRRVSSTGRPSGEVLRISAPEQTEALFPAIAYNRTNHEYLVTFDTSTSIFGQRIDAADARLLGGNFAIGETNGGIRSAVAWSQAGNGYLVAYFGPGGGRTEVYLRRVSHDGLVKGAEVNLSNDPHFSGYPSVTYGERGDQFLVTWDHEPVEDRGRIRGCRVEAASGKPIGEAFDVTTGGFENRSSAAYDTLRHQWLVQFNDSGTRGNSYDQGARLVTSDGKVGAAIAVASGKAFEGDTQFGCDIAYLPGLGGRYFSSFQREADEPAMAGQELDAVGRRIGDAAALGVGPYTSLSNAANTRDRQFLTAWEGLSGKPHRIFVRVYRPNATDTP
jgi:hypothetical protein